MKRLTILALGSLFLNLAWAADSPSAAELAKLIKNLSAKDAKARVTACEEIAAACSDRDASVAIDALVDVLKKDAEPSVRAAATTALKGIKGSAPKTVPVLKELLTKGEKDRTAYRAYLACLIRYRSQAREVLPLLRELADKARADRIAAEKNLEKFKEAGDKEGVRRVDESLVELRELEQILVAARTAVLDLDH
jgi:hypothetical protein